MNYESWADALSKYWLADNSDGPVVLALEPEVLIDVAKTVDVTFSSAELAVNSFVAAVRTYQRSLGSQPWRVELHGGQPRFLLLIAIQIYAASQMDDEEGHHTRNAYYIQLESFVGARAMSSNFAADHGEAHRRLWRTLKDWLAEHGRTIILPSDAVGTHERNVGLPKSQALLRLGDLAELPLFFRQCHYLPDVAYSLKRVEKDVFRWRESYEAFPSAWARSVLGHQLKFPTACRQIHHELQLWDGRWEITDAGQRDRGDRNRARLWFGINRKRALLVSRIVDSDEESQLLNIDELAKVLSGKTTKDGLAIALKRGLCLCRYDSDDGAFKQVAAVEPGDRCLFAASDDNADAIDLLNTLISSSRLAQDVRWYLDEDDNGSEESLTGIPSSCALVEFRVADPLPYHASVDRNWHAFLKSPAGDLKPTGGLCFGRERNWVEGAGPSIRIVGTQLPQSIAIDGVEVPVEGRIVSNPILSELGNHHVYGMIAGQLRNCTVAVGDPVEPAFGDAPEHAWIFDKDAVAWQAPSEAKAFLFGMRISISQNAALISLREEQQAAIRLLVGHPLQQAYRSATRYNHPLTRSLLKINANGKNHTKA